MLNLSVSLVSILLTGFAVWIVTKFIFFMLEAMGYKFPPTLPDTFDRILRRRKLKLLRTKAWMLDIKIEQGIIAPWFSEVPGMDPAPHNTEMHALEESIAYAKLMHRGE